MLRDRAYVLELPGRAAPVEVAFHAQSARRLRLVLPETRDSTIARKIERELRSRLDVTSAIADPRTGRVLVEYAENAGLLAGLRTRSQERPRARTPGVRRTEQGVPWHALEVPDVLERLASSWDGLSAKAAQRRLAELGANLAEEITARSQLAILAGQVANLPTAVLLGSSGLSVILGDLMDAAAILTVVGLNAAIGYVIERKNEQLLASWLKLQAGEVNVVRDGAMTDVPAADLVPGDVLLVRAGDVVPADARVIDAHRLSSDEAPLTGESEPQSKRPQAVAETAILAEHTSMLYAGTTISSGRGRAVIVRTGPNTELAAIRRLVEQTRAPGTPLENRLEQLGRSVTLGAIGASVVAGVAQFLHGRPLTGVLRSAVALGVAGIPEGLPVVSTAALVRSMQRMRQMGIVVRRLVSAETLGGVTVICADKTGTLTQNDMQVEVLEAEDRERALTAGLLNSDIELQSNGIGTQVSGSSTERAIVRAAEAAGLDPGELRKRYPRRLLRERAGGIHYVVSIHDAPEGGGVAFVKGAPEQVAELCDLDAHARTQYLARNDQLARGGLRVLALAWKPLADESTPVDRGYRWIGLLGLRDPLRPTASDAVAAAARTGIRTVILTGDQLRTAEAIARQVGLQGEAVDGSALARRLEAGDPAAEAQLDRVGVLARVSPGDKAAIVRAFRRRGEIVAMVGDGINDAPALKIADVGVAVGAHSSDLARQVADVVLAEEDLRAILAAVGEGRIVQDNLRRAIRFLFATNLSEMTLVVAAALIGVPEPLTPMQLLWINLLTDTLPALALALEPGRPEVLDRPPAPPQAPLLSRAALGELVRDGALMAGLGAAGMLVGGPRLAFATLTSAQLSYATVCRAPGTRMRGRFLGLVGGAIAMQGAALVTSPLRKLLRLGRLSPLEPLGFLTGLVLPPLVAGVRQSGEIVRRAPKEALA